VLFRNPNSIPAPTAKDKRVLRNTQIDASHPGSLLHDFEVLLQYVQETNTRLTGTHLPPLKALRPLNERMSRPIEHGLTRPQQKSFPHINGLYLLLRASGLTTIDARGKTARLHLDEAMHTQWQALNPTERYFTLLETWVLRGDPAIIGEREGVFAFTHPVMRWATFHGHRFSSAVAHLSRMGNFPEAGKALLRALCASSAFSAFFLYSQYIPPEEPCRPQPILFPCALAWASSAN